MNKEIQALDDEHKKLSIELEVINAIEPEGFYALAVQNPEIIADWLLHLAETKRKIAMEEHNAKIQEVGLMKIENMAMALDCSEGEVIDLLELNHLIEIKKTVKKNKAGYGINEISISEIGQFFCDYEQNPDFYETEWHVDKLWKLSDFQEYVEAALEA